ncbi:unnamed protein product [Somion occarium]|uniref:AB hydrolase-1 domain-containing protein n=1 Tax=Somion occarium TaxID=3059160 RepID=A0ABP1DP60_9APHY
MPSDYYAGLDNEFRNVKRHILSYERDGVRLQFYATNVLLYTHPRTSQDLTLIVCHGLAMNPAMYFPTLKYLNQLIVQSGSLLRLRSIWFVEHANHGDSAVLNEALLKEHFSDRFPLTYYGVGIVTLLDSGLLDPTDPNLIPIGHCGGSGGVIFAAKMLRDRGTPFRRIVLLEPTLFDLDIEENFKALEQRVRIANRKRPRVWPTVEDAMAYHRNRVPWKLWDPEVLELMSKTVFWPAPGGGVTQKTTYEQESACFEYKEPLETGQVLLGLVTNTPVHMALGERPDMWTEEMYASQRRIVAKMKPSLASFSVIPGAGHYVVQDNPKGSAQIIFNILQLEYGKRQPATSVQARL